LISEAILEVLDSKEFAHALAASASEDSGAEQIEADLQDDRLQLDELAAMYGRKEMTAREWTVAKAPIQQRIGENERRLAAFSGSSALDGYIGHGKALRSQWSALAPTRQQAIVGALIDTISIGPAVRGRNSFDPSRVTPHWKV